MEIDEETCECLSPNLDKFQYATPRQIELVQKYTMVKIYPGGKTTVILLSGCQSFNINENVIEDFDHASWYCLMIAKALETILEQEKNANQSRS